MVKELGLDELAYLERKVKHFPFKKKKCGLVALYGVPPGKKKRVRILTHNGCVGSQWDAMQRKRYQRKGYKKFVSKKI